MLSIEHLNKRKKRYIQNYLENDELQIKCDNNFQEYFPILIENKKMKNAWRKQLENKQKLKCFVRIRWFFTAVI